MSKTGISVTKDKLVIIDLKDPGFVIKSYTTKDIHSNSIKEFSKEFITNHADKILKILKESLSDNNTVVVFGPCNRKKSIIDIIEKDGLLKNHNILEKNCENINESQMLLFLRNDLSNN